MGTTGGIHGYGSELDAHIFGRGSGRRRKGDGCRTDPAPLPLLSYKSGRSSVVICTHYPPYTQTLMRNIALCQQCQQAMYMGFAGIKGEKEAMQYLQQIRGFTKDEGVV